MSRHNPLNSNNYKAKSATSNKQLNAPTQGTPRPPVDSSNGAAAEKNESVATAPYIGRW